MELDMSDNMQNSKDIDVDMTHSNNVSELTDVQTSVQNQHENNYTEDDIDQEVNTGAIDDKSYENTNVNTEDCVLMADSNDNNNKYLVNPNFHPNLKHPGNEDQGQDTTEHNEKDEPSMMHQSWLPSILKGESWPEQTSEYDINNGGAEDIEINPLLSVRDTVLRKNDTYAREGADWKKYKEKKVFKLINNNKLKDIPSNQSTIPNTFAKKFNKIHGLNDQNMGTPDSPLKLFGAQQNTYTKYLMNNMLNQLSPNKIDKLKDLKLPNVIEQSDDLYDKILAGNSSKGRVMHENNMNTNNSEGRIDEEENDNTERHEDITSDAEEFSSFPSTTKRLVKDGNQLFENIREGYQNGILPIASTVSQSDYTSAEEDNDEKEDADISNSFSKQFTDEESTHRSFIYHDKNGHDSIEKLRDQIVSRAEKYNAEFKISKPKLQAKYVALKDKENDNSESVTKNKPKGLNFISADEYKNKIYDKKLKKFVYQSEYADMHDGNSYTQESQDNLLENLTMSDPEKTNNSILRNKDSIKKLNQEVSFAFDNDIGEELSKEYIDRIDNNDGKNSDETMNDDESFAFTDSFLVEAIAESYPIEDWNMVKELNISEFQLDKLFHLKKMTPNIWYLNASHNKISQNFGIPQNIQVLNLEFNMFSSISAKFDNFPFLQVLNLSHNELADIRCLKELKNLTNLNLSHNRIDNIQFLENFRMLRYLNLSNNKISGRIDFRNYTLWFLEDLLIDDNEINELINITDLPQLIQLSANNNNIEQFVYDIIEEESKEESILHTSLRKISMNNNNIYDEIDFSDYPNLKEINLDRAFMENICNITFYTEKVSLRHVNNEKINEDILKYSLQSDNFKVLYLTGGILPGKLPLLKDKFSSINVLDISAMNIEQLPNKFGEFFPLLIDLNLNFNRLENLKGLENTKHLKQLKLLGNQIGNIEDIVEFTSKMRMSLKLFDLRVNPITKKFYPFIFYGGEPEKDGENEFNGEFSEDFNTFLLQDEEDIDAFSIEYTKLYETEGIINWTKKLRRHQRKLPLDIRNQRDDYMMQILVWFEHIRYLDGNMISRFDKTAYMNKFLAEGADRR